MKNNKNYKIKRYNSIYKKNLFNISLTPIQIVILCFIITILFSIGWVTSTIISDRIKNPPSKSELFNDNDKSKENNENINEKPEIKNEFPVKTTYIDKSIINDNEKLLGYIKNIKEQKIEALILVLKDDVGNLYYKSNNNFAIKAGSIKEQLNIQNLIKILKENNIKLFAQISAFKDHIAPSKNDSLNIRYKNTNYRWLDNSLQNNGKPWMDPSAKDVQSYIKDIVKEIFDFGIDNIIIENFGYPKGVIGIESANFVKGNNPTDKISTLKNFYNEIEQFAKQNNKNIYIKYDINDIINNNEFIYGTNPLEINSQNIFIDLNNKIDIKDNNSSFDKNDLNKLKTQVIEFILNNNKNIHLFIKDSEEIIKIMFDKFKDNIKYYLI